MEKPQGLAQEKKGKPFKVFLPADFFANMPSPLFMGSQPRLGHQYAS
jgi:hypothetical protein